MNWLERLWKSIDVNLGRSSTDLRLAATPTALYSSGTGPSNTKSPAYAGLFYTKEP